MGVKQTRIMAVVNEKGGVGKTVTAINLAAALTRNDKRVLVVDMDPQSNATWGLGVKPGKDDLTVYDLIKGKEGVSAQDAVISTAWEGLDLIPSHPDLAGAEVELVEDDTESRQNRLEQALEALNQNYDFILVDTPPSLSLLTINVLTYADEILVPCQTHPFAYEALSELFDTIKLVKEALHPKLRISGVLATFFDPRTSVCHKILEKLRTDERTKDLLYNTVIRTNTTIADSALVEKPVVFYRAGSYGAIDYNDLADEVIEQG